MARMNSPFATLPVDPIKFKWFFYTERGTSMTDASKQMGWSDGYASVIAYKERIHLRKLFDIMDWKNHRRRAESKPPLELYDIYELIRPRHVPPLLEFDMRRNREITMESRRKEFEELEREFEKVKEEFEGEG